MAIAFDGEGEFDDDDEFDLFGTPEIYDDFDDEAGEDGEEDLKPCPQCKTSGRDIRDASQECRVCDGVGWI